MSRKVNGVNYLGKEGVLHMQRHTALQGLGGPLLFSSLSVYLCLHRPQAAAIQ